MSVQIYGGSLASLALAYQLAKDGVSYEWQTMGEKVGGHFSGLRINEKSYDIGMVLLEFSPGKNNPSKYTQADTEQSALRQFFSDVTLEDASISVMLQGCLRPDYVISDNIEAIETSGSFGNVNTPDSKHPKNKWTEDWFEVCNYESVCRTLYSNFYSRYLEKFANKVTSGQANRLSARYHRSAWLPLYYPETAKGDGALDPYPFLKMAGTNVASFIQSKLDFIKTSPHALVVEDKSAQLTEEKLSTESGVKKFFGCDLFKFPEVQKYFDATKHFHPKYDVCILKLKGKESDLPDCIFDVEDDAIFRVSFTQSSDGLTVFGFFEANALSNSEEEFLDYCTHYASEKLECSSVEELFVKTGLTGPRLPEAGAEENLSELNDFILNRYASEDCHFFGPQLGLNAMAMNKQINHALNIWRQKI